MDKKKAKQLYEKQFRATKKKEISEKARLYYSINKDRLKAANKAYRLSNKDKINIYQRQYKKSKYQSDLDFRLTCTLRSRLWGAINNNQKAGSAIKDLGCTIEFLKTYLESKFLDNMSWNNYGEWEIDHIEPLSKFNLSDVDQLRKACHYTNLQPLWKLDNIEKSNK